MRAIFYTTLLSIFTLFAASCVKQSAPKATDSPVIVHDVETPARTGETQEASSSSVRRETQSVEVVNNGDAQKLRKYSVVVATLTKQKGITALQNFFKRDGIDFFVVKNPQGRFYFIIASSDSEEEAMKARADFLIKHTVNKSRKDLWEKYYIQVTDTFILERK